MCSELIYLLYPKISPDITKNPLEIYLETHRIFIWSAYSYNSRISQLCTRFFVCLNGYLVITKISHIRKTTALRHLNLQKYHKRNFWRHLTFWFGTYSAMVPRNLSFVQCLFWCLKRYLVKIKISHISKTLAWRPLDLQKYQTGDFWRLVVF